MKRKAFLIVVLALVLCLACGMLFVACNDNNGDTLAYEVTADVRKGKYSFGSKYTLVDGTIAESGDFFVTFEIEYGTSKFEVEIGAINIPAAQTPEA